MEGWEFFCPVKYPKNHHYKDAMKRSIIILSVAIISLIFGITCFISAQSPIIGAGVMTTIKPCMNFDEAFSRLDAVELLADMPQNPDYKGDIKFDPEIFAKNIRFKRDIWCLEFSFKPIRMISIDVPTKDGTIVKKLVWYMIYSVTNTGESIRTVPDQDKTYQIPEQTEYTIEPCDCEYCMRNPAQKDKMPEKIQLFATPEIRNQTGAFKHETYAGDITCVPHFILATDRLLETVNTSVDTRSGDVLVDAPRKNVMYEETFVPLALGPITEREKSPNGEPQKFETTVSMAGKAIKPHETVWSVVMWTDVDPRITFFSVNITGLTNAYKWVPRKNGENYVHQPGDKALTNGDIWRKTLVLKFRRLGDEFSLSERQIRYGDTTVSEHDKRDYEWEYFPVTSE